MAELQYGYYAVNPAYERLLEEYLSLRLTNEAAYEHARHGFVRRLGTLKRCIENVYSTYLPERFDKPSRNECLDLAIITPFMTHSFSEGARPVGFHFQVLADWNTVVEMADKFLQELRPSGLATQHDSTAEPRSLPSERRS